MDLGNAAIANMLGLRSSFKGGHKNHLTHAVLGGLLTRGLVEQDEANKRYTKSVTGKARIPALQSLPRDARRSHNAPPILVLVLIILSLRLGVFKVLNHVVHTGIPIGSGISLRVSSMLSPDSRSQSSMRVSM